MKRLFLAACFLLTGTMIVFAQKYETIKNEIITQQFDKAKADLDKNWTNAKFTSKPEAFILKASVLASLGNMPDKGAEGQALMMEADSFYRIYVGMDPAMSLAKEIGYSNTPIYLYTNLLNKGIAEYNNQQYKISLDLFEKGLFYSDILNKTGIYAMPLDTTATLLAGASAQNLMSPETDKVAMKYYKILADANVAGNDGNTVYRFLARKSFDDENIDDFNKYMAKGRELYPEEEFYTYKEEDFLFSIEDQDVKRRRIETKLAKDPGNFKVQAAYGEYLFELLNPRNTDDPLPDNADELEVKMVKAFDGAAAAEPNNPLPVMNLANHFINKSIRTNNVLVAHQQMMRDKQKANTPEQKPGKPAPKPAPPEQADVDRRVELQKKYDVEITQSKGYFEKAVKIFQAKTSLETIDKQNYRNAVSYLIDINKDLKNSAIRDKNAADETKYAAEEKKYLALYSTINS